MSFKSQAVEMSDDEVQYASVVIKNRGQPRAKEEEVVYDQVRIVNQPAQQTPDINDKTAERCRRYQLLAGCFGILCVILVMSIIGVWLYLSAVHEKAENQLRSSQQVLLEHIQNLTDRNNKLSSDYEHLMVQFNNMTTALENNITTLSAENYNLTTAISILENNIRLSEENPNLTSINQELRAEKKNLTDRIENMEKTWKELNVSRAQWSVDSYCPKNKDGKGRNCSTCQNGWMNRSSSCYAYNDAELTNRRTWEGARDDCGTKSSELTVVSDQTEKDYVINSLSPVISDIQGYWIGLRAVGGKWKWLDGSELTDQAWIQQQQKATDGQCVTSLKDKGWSSVSCNDRNAWICEKKALIL